MEQNHADLQRLLDRAAIHDLLIRYFQGLDRGDPEQVRSCFTHDVLAYYDQRPPVLGIEALLSSFRTFKSREAGNLKVTTHFMGNLNINLLRDDAAETETNAIAFLVRPHERGDFVAIRSLRYLDGLRRMPDGWRISERRHTLDWSCEVPTDFAVTMAQRLSTRPAR